MKVIEGGATTWILEQVIIALSIHGQTLKDTLMPALED